MVERAASELQLDLARSYLIGDHVRDVQLAKQVGAKAVLLTAGPIDHEGLGALKAAQALPDAFAQSMTEAVDWVLADAAARVARAASTPSVA